MRACERVWVRWVVREEEEMERDGEREREGERERGRECEIESESEGVREVGRQREWMIARDSVG